MNTEKTKTFRRCFIFLSFWIVITLLGLFLICEGGSGSAGYRFQSIAIFGPHSA